MTDVNTFHGVHGQRVGGAGSSAQLRSMRVQQPFGMLLRRFCAGDSSRTMSATDEKTRTARPALSWHDKPVHEQTAGRALATAYR